MEYRVPFIDIDKMDFRIYSDKDIEKISVMQVTSEEAINKLGHPNKGGLYDPRMGPVAKISNGICETCRQTGEHCMGHCGHIELPLPVYNPMLLTNLVKLLRLMCLGCGQLNVKPVNVLVLQCQLRLLDAGYCHEALRVPHLVSSVTSEEVKLTEEDKEQKGKQDDPMMLSMLQAELQRYYDKVIAGEPDGQQHDVRTSNVRCVREECMRPFIASLSVSGSRCRFCHFARFSVHYKFSQMIINTKGKSLQEQVASGAVTFENPGLLCLDASRSSVLTALQVRELLRKAWQTDSTVLGLLFPLLNTTTFDHPTDMFFISKMLVIPTKFRPVVVLLDQVMESESCVLLKNVLRLCRCMKLLSELIKDPSKQESLGPEVQLILNELQGKTHHQKADKVWQLMQGSIDNLLDAKACSETSLTQKGIKQIFEKKAGLFRSNLMGKRVNFSARSVLAPDPALAVDEVGVPMDFATHLTYPVPVTPWNVAHLRKLVIRGPKQHPGAQMIEEEDGRIIHLMSLSLEQRTAFAKKLLTPPESNSKLINPCKIVYRQLEDGDLVLMNRQPTLHRPSIQAHKARVMSGMRVLRMPYANCKAYNADFDGDEMNMHFPQNELARSEAKHLVTTHMQYLTPKDGAPLAGLVQDCVVAGVLLSVRGSMFNREDYMQMVNVALQDFPDRVKVLTPAILKPKMLWSGKQIISTVLHNLIPKKQALPTFKFKTSLKAEVWQSEPPRPARGGTRWGATHHDAMAESEFVMREGELVCGVLDKSAIGSTSHGLIHVCYDLYGGEVATNLLTAFNRLCMYFLQLHGHTISSKEFLTPPSVATSRRDKLKELIESAPANVLQKLEMDAAQFRQFWESNHMSFCHKNLAMVDAAYTQVLGKTTSQITTTNEQGLYRKTLDNSMRLMVDSGAKGSKVNMNQMASLFGPTAIDGKRMPISLAGKSLPSFSPYDMNPCAGGYISTRFMTGMDPPSYFFLAVVGRDSLQHTAVKTANSGYMQRCLIKHLEGIQVGYDMTVRNSDGLVLQFEYGEDGLEVNKTPFLRTPQTLEVVVDNFPRLLSPAQLDSAGTAAVSKSKKKVTKWLKKHSNRSKGDRCSGFLLFCQDHQEPLSKKRKVFDDRKGRAMKSIELQKQWFALPEHERQAYKDRALVLQPVQPAPLLSQYLGNKPLGALPEVLDQLIDDYYEMNYSTRNSHHKKYDKKTIETAVAHKVQMSLVQPGEAVGAICAQAIGEPLTQMTLNTFHFAGRDELNVTLGVPRMVEILRTASANISTPIMEVPFRPEVTRAQAELLKKKFTEVTLKQVLHMMEADCIEVNCGEDGLYHHLVRLRFTLLPTSHYRQELPVTSRDVLSFMESYYFHLGIIKRLSAKSKKVHDICATMEKEKSHLLESTYRGEEEKEFAIEKNTKKKASSTSDDDQDSEDDNADDGMADAGRLKKHSEQDYEDGDEDDEDEPAEMDVDEDCDEDNNKNKKKKSGAAATDRKEERESEDEGCFEGDEEDEEEQEIVGGSTKTPAARAAAASGLTKEQIKKRRNAVIMRDPTIVDYKFDTVDEQWCELTLRIPNIGRKYDFKSIVSNTASKSYVYRIPGIKRAFIEEKTNGELCLKTEGVNIYKLVQWANVLDINRLYTNDIQRVRRTFGIEAAQRSIIREIRAVQNAYNITIDYRHLTLLADYFTCDGLYKACSRGALGSSQSTIQQMSYESTLAFLKTALVSNTSDKMQSPSARIATGQTVHAGTNVMDVLVNSNYFMHKAVSV